MMTARRITRPLLSTMILAALAVQPLTVNAAPQSQAVQDIALVNRVSWGVNDSTLRQAESQGIENWLQGQLHPTPGDHLPPAVMAEINALPALHKPSTQLAFELNQQFQAAQAAQKAQQAQQAALLVANPLPPGAPVMAPAITPQAPGTPNPPTPQDIRQAYMRDVMHQTQLRNMLRDLYSPDQLREQMTWFWFNHFNVFVDKGEIRLFLADYEDRALRPNALGNFRALLEATLRSPAMLQYLDNAQNAGGHINENYAREIMELHTMGVGSGYSQKDVQELARILTGVGVAPADGKINIPPRFQGQEVHDGMFFFNPARHDYGDKMFLGHVIKGSGFGEVEQALDLLASNPATAKHISTQLAEYFVADQPQASLVNKMTQRFLQSQGDIAAVLDLMFHSPEFRASLSHPLLKDPQHYVVSAVRMAYDTRPILNAQPMLNWLNALAEPLYGHLTPDGYQLERSAWNGPGQIEQRFEIAQAIGNGAAGLFKGEAANAQAQAAFPQLQGALYYGGLDQTLAPETRTALAQATSPQEWNVFFLASPDFMRR